jgi:hypothetical protein
MGLPADVCRSGLRINFKEMKKQDCVRSLWERWGVIAAITLGLVLGASKLVKL